MKLSIVVPVYNVEHYIERFLLSIIPQMTPNVELIIVDDKGNDKSIEIAKKLLEQKEINVQFVTRAQNGGLSAARNSGIEVSVGEYLYFADSDDVIESNAIADFLNAIDKYPSTAFFCFNASYKNIGEPDFKHWREGGLLPRKMTGSAFLEYIYEGKIGAYIWQYLFRKQLFNQIRFKEGSVWEDSIILPQILSLVDEVVSFEDIFVYQYILRSGSITQSIHPQIDNVVGALNEVEEMLYPLKSEPLYGAFVQFRTRLTMRLSRECFVRSKDFRRLMNIHKQWGNQIPSENIQYLKNNHMKKSAVFLSIIKTMPALLYLLYRLHLLR